MKTFHYYASPEFKAFDEEQVNEIELTTAQITKEMVLFLISQHAVLKPPYELLVPRSILYAAHCWNIPATLLTISPVEVCEYDVSPIAIGILRFPNGQRGVCIVIHARRVLEQSYDCALHA